MSWRYIAQRIAGPSKGTFLDWNLDLQDIEIEDNVGPGWLNATIMPEIAMLEAPDGRPVLEKWSTAIWAEEGGLIRGGGILVENAFAGPKRTLQCMSYSGYPTGIPLESEWSWTSVEPISVANAIWTHVQSYANGKLDLAVIMDNVSPVRIGSVAQPYKLSWWEAPDCGGIIDGLAKSTPFGVMETHKWHPTIPNKIVHELHMKYPTFGKRRTDLRFMLGENIKAMPGVTDDGMYFANEVLGLGAGIGRAMVRTTSAVVDDKLRRVSVLLRNDITTTTRLHPYVSTSLAKHSGTLSLASIVVIEHPNANITSLTPGDEILVQADVGWMKISQWCTIASIKTKPQAGNEAELTLEGLAT